MSSRISKGHSDGVLMNPRDFSLSKSLSMSQTNANERTENTRTLSFIFASQKANDPFKELRQFYQQKSAFCERRYEGSLDFEAGDICLDLKGARLSGISHFLYDLIRTKCSNVIYLDCSFSLIKSTLKNFLNFSIQTLLMRGCHPNIVYKLLSFLDGLEEEMCKTQSELMALDVSSMELQVEDIESLINYFPRLEKLFISKCNIDRLPSNLLKSGKIHYVDLSFNHIISLSSFLTEILPESGQSEKITFSKEQGLDRGLIQKAQFQDVYIAKHDNKERFMHVDLRGNNLSLDTYKRLENYSTVKISSDYQIVFLPGNFFLYLDYPKPPSIHGLV